MALARVQNENERLEALRKLAILNSEHLPEYDAVVSNLSHMLECPIALISIVDRTKVWFKAAVGLDTPETRRENSFCTHTILGQDILIVPDTLEDPRFQDSPLVTGPLGARFYAGCPISLDGQNCIGTICVIDHKPRQLTDVQVTQLRNTAKVVEGLIKSLKAGYETREALEKAEQEQAKADRHQGLLTEIAQVSGVGGWDYDPRTGLMTWTDKTRDILGVDAAFEPDLDTLLAFLCPSHRDVLESAFHEGLRDGVSWDRDLQLTNAKGQEIWVRLAGHAVVENGSVRRLVGVLLDITRARQKDQEARAAEAVRRSTFEALQEGILLVCPEGCIRSLNSAAMDLLGLTGQNLADTDLTGKCAHDLPVSFQMPSLVDGSSVNPFKLAIRDPGRIRDVELQVRDEPSGRLRWLRMNAQSIEPSGEHDLAGAVISLADITKLKQQAETLQVFFDNFPGGLVHHDSGQILSSWNSEFVRLFNIPEEFLQKDPPPTLQDTVAFLAARGDYGPGKPDEIAEERIRKYGSSNTHIYERTTSEGRVLEVRGTTLANGGNVTSIMDITDRKRMEEQLVEKERLATKRLNELEAVIANMRQGVCVFDNEGRISLWNKQFLDLFDKPQGEVQKGMHLIDVLELEKSRNHFDGDSIAYYLALRDRLDAGEVVRTTLRHPNGKVLSIVRTPLPDGGWIGTHEDVTLRERATEKITHAAHHDTLTGLANRTLFNLKLEDAITRSQLYGEASDLLMVDLDRFKPVNDTYGHHVGDELLTLVATRLKDCVRSKDTVARLGGDEFAVIVRNTEAERGLATRIAQRIVTELKRPYQIEGNSILISASVGIAAIQGAGDAASPLLKKADVALYAVKNAGRDGFQHFEEQA